jgi:hypothetical protein
MVTRAYTPFPLFYLGSIIRNKEQTMVKRKVIVELDVDSNESAQETEQRIYDALSNEWVFNGTQTCEVKVVEEM